MARNMVYEDARRFALDVSAVNGSGTGNKVMSGDPGVVGALPFVAVTDEDDAGTGMATVDTGGAYNLTVKGVDGGGNVAVAPGDILYWDNTNEWLSKVTTDPRFGYALEAVASGATDTSTAVKVGY